ncbi:hypothetical protein BTA51_00155 [Hahella sp. CCB-MM4]|uniref:lipopolysaccharide biosynthesis protein n=1 Tax=Hahella sp. (strain CCB-MM4) TaxID=1926491 RepID=UPI000B9A7BBD|nr:oligosaccharide flippase family protein [Hahella sp. CCB-MM4]OZG74862.1 hypothetical protein BTA51_00155 [Hahella sp. CCB-MM4]
MSREADKTRKNIIVIFIGQLLLGLITALSYKLMVGYVGAEEGGLIVYSIALLNSLRALFDLGLAKTVIKYIAENRDIREKLVNVCQYFTAIYGLIFILLMISVTLFSHDISMFFFSGTEFNSALGGWHVFLYAAPIILIISYLSSVLAGFERFVVVSLVDLLVGVLLYALSAALLVSGVSFSNIAVVIVSLYLLKMTLFLGCCVKRVGWGFLLPKYKSVFHHEVKGHMRNMFLLSGLLFVHKQADKLVVGKLLAISDAGFYVIIFSLIGKLSILTQSISQALSPQFSKGKHEESRLKYLKLSRFNLGFMMPIYIGAAIVMDEILVFLLGNEFPKEYLYCAYAVILYFFLNAAIRLFRTLLISRSGSSLVLKADVFGVVLSFPLLIVSAFYYGIIGVCVSMLVFYLVMIPVLVVGGYQKVLDSSPVSWLNQVIEVSKLPFLFAIPIVGYKYIYDVPAYQDILLAMTFGLICFVVLYRDWCGSRKL